MVYCVYNSKGGLTMKLYEYANNPHDKDSFLIFLDVLKDDYMSNKESWENQSIDTFLDAIHGWISDYNRDDIDFSNPTWKDIAAIFYVGKIYE